MGRLVAPGVPPPSTSLDIPALDRSFQVKNRIDPVILASIVPKPGTSSTANGRLREATTPTRRSDGSARTRLPLTNLMSLKSGPSPTQRRRSTTASGRVSTVLACNRTLRGRRRKAPCFRVGIRAVSLISTVAGDGSPEFSCRDTPASLVRTLRVHVARSNTSEPNPRRTGSADVNRGAVQAEYPAVEGWYSLRRSARRNRDGRPR